MPSAITAAQFPIKSVLPQCFVNVYSAAIRRLLLRSSKLIIASDYRHSGPDCRYFHQCRPWLRIFPAAIF
jgi:hypothetical protein